MLGQGRRKRRLWWHYFQPFLEKTVTEGAIKAAQWNGFVDHDNRRVDDRVKSESKISTVNSSDWQLLVWTWTCQKMFGPEHWKENHKNRFLLRQMKRLLLRVGLLLQGVTITFRLSSLQNCSPWHLHHHLGFSLFIGACLKNENAFWSYWMSPF